MKKHPSFSIECLLMAILFIPVIANTQNVGIGTSAPLTQLDVLSLTNHTARFTGNDNMFISLYENAAYRGYLGSYSGSPEDVDFGTGVGNSNGKLHLTIQASPKLSILPNGNIGIGTLSPSRKLEVAGSLGINGGLYLNGSSGSSGQILTSNGSSTPSWQTLSSSYSNNIRFATTCSNNTVLSGDLTLGTRYNTNTSAVVINPTSITFNQTGIYHFEVAIGGRVDYGSPLGYDPGFYVNLYLNGGAGPGNNPVAEIGLGKNGTSNRYAGTAFAGTDLYITAGQVMNIGFIYFNTPAGYSILNTFGYLRGYLISE